MRYLILVCAVLMQVCLGATYSWSVYVQPLKTLTGLAQGPVQIPFTLFYFAFPLTMMIAGNYLPRTGPRRSAVAGGVLFGGGWLLAGLGSSSFLFTILGIGLLAGVGAGMAYIVPIAVCIRWFPKSKGLVTGIAVAGFGGGAAMVSQVGGYLINSMGVTPFNTFFIFGILFLFTVVLAGSVMRFPDTGAAAGPAKTLAPKQVLTHINFRILYFAMFMGLAAGFAVNANLKELYPGGGNAVGLGITAVSLFALANAAGRVIWGAVFDRTASATAIQANLFFQAVVLALAPFLVETGTGFIVLSLVTGFNYGGVLVLYVSSASRSWGTENIGQIYGWLFTANIPASLAPILAGFVYDRFHNFTPALVVLSVLLGFSAFMIRQKAGAVNEENCLG
ncbi:MAG: MFS transporter [Desulfobacterales bacterium]|nr:MFS transporter [Desulfobacterales bacterium]